LRAPSSRPETPAQLPLSRRKANRCYLGCGPGSTAKLSSGTENLAPMQANSLLNAARFFAKRSRRPAEAGSAQAKNKSRQKLGAAAGMASNIIFS